MTDYSPPTPDAFEFPGNDTGILIIHGFTGSPSEVRPLGQHLAQQGYTVVGPLLPGHGTTWQDLDRCRWQDWSGAVEQAYLDLKQRSRKVLMVGVSMGGLLTLYMAERRPEITAVVLMAPALIPYDWRSHLIGLLKYFVQFTDYDPKRDGDDLTDPQARQRYLWSYPGTPMAAAEQLIKLQGVVRPDLHKVKMPALLFHSTRDRSVKPASAQYTYDHITSQDKELVWLHNSGHCLWVDSEKEQVWEKTSQFIARHCAS